MVSNSVDYTNQFNANNGIKIDISLWQNVTVHISGSVSGTVNILGTNDAGAIQGVSNGSAISSANYTAIQATNLATGADVTSISAAGNYKVVVATRYLQVGGSGAQTDGKVILFFNSIS